MSKKQPDPAKVSLRNEVAEKISKMSLEEKNNQSRIIYDKLMKHPSYEQANRISIYLSTDDEVNTLPIIKDIEIKGKKAFVPQYAGGKMKMLHMQKGDEDVMEQTKHGIAQHCKSHVREDAMETGGLDLFIIPGVAFTRSGHRLGHGGGYYDKYLAEVFARHSADPANFLKPKLIALAFVEQVYDMVPVNETDVVLDEVLTAD